ncbi:MAG: hypothetical protein D6776_11455 [Planctomycetota bacterium]|nr:MAG: hypothetical protein D6776_11455 [Planctomycetota bacterium]
MRYRNGLGVLGLGLWLAFAGHGWAQSQPGQNAAPAGPKARVLVLTFAKNEPGYADMVQGLAEAALLEHGLPLVDRGQIEARYGIENLKKGLLYDPEAKMLAELRTRFGADVVLTVTYFRQFTHQQEFAGSMHRFFKTDVRVRAIAADTGKVLFSGGGWSPIQARTDGFERLVTQTVSKAAEAIVQRWRGGEPGKPHAIELLARHFDADHLLELEAALRTTPGVLEVSRRDFGGPATGEGNALLELQIEVPIEQLTRSLRALTRPAIRVTASSGERIEVELAPEPEVGFVEPRDGAALGRRTFEVRVRASEGVQSLTVNGSPARRVPDRPGLWQVQLTAPEQAAWQLTAAARDSFGRTVQAQITVHFDTEPPTLQWLEPAADVSLTNRRKLAVRVRARDEGSGVAQLRVGKQPLAPSQDDPTVWEGEIELNEGPNPLELVAVDRVGNRAELRREITLDSTPPSLDATVVAIIEGRVNENGVRIICQGKEWKVDDDGRFRIAVEAPVGESVTVVAIDPAGNRTEKVYRIGEGGKAEPQ